MKRRDGFTLIELLTVMGVIAMLATILIPSFTKVLDLSRRAVCKNNLGQLVKAVVSYKDENDGFLPPHRTGPGADQWWGADSLWRYLGREEVYRCPSMGSRGWQFNAAWVGYGYNAWFLGWYDGVNDTPAPEAGITPDLRCNFSYVRNASELIVFADSAHRGGGARGASYCMWYPEADAHVDMRHGETGCAAFFDGGARSFVDEDINPQTQPVAGNTPLLRYWDPRQGQ